MQCTNCDAPITKDTRFCAGCGQALPWSQALGAGRHAAVLGDQVSLDELAKLNEEKKRLTQQLEALLEDTAERGPSSEEQRRYTELRAEWLRVSDTITDKMSGHSTRQSENRRRESDSRLTKRRQVSDAFQVDDRRSGRVRRAGDRRGGLDRRNPFPNEM